MESLEELLKDELLEDAELSSEDTAAIEAEVEAEFSLVGQAAAAEAAVKARTIDWHFMIEREWVLQEKRIYSEKNGQGKYASFCVQNQRNGRCEGAEG